MGKFSDTSIKDIIGKLNDSFFLPDIQRDYVWLNNERENKIENLFDSILRGYPIGSFLFWKLKKSDIASSNDNASSDKLNFQLYKFQENFDERKSYNEKIDIDKVNCDELNIVLDGQQRLTSLYIGLKGSRTLHQPRMRWDNPNAFVEKKLYLNLRYKPQLEDPDDNYKFMFFGVNQVPQADENNYWFKVGEILEIGSLLKYVRDRGLSDEEAEILERLQQSFVIEQNISFFTESEKDLNKVLKIFIRVNSGGTKLSYSDLLMSILTASFSSDIKTLMQNLVEECLSNGFGVFGRDQVLKTCLLLTDSNPKFLLSNFCRGNIRKIESNWIALVNSIRDAVHLLKDFGYANNLWSGYIISTVALYLYKRQMSYTKVSVEDRKAMADFVRIAQIKSYFTTSLDTKIIKVRDRMNESKTFEDFNKIMASDESLKVTSDVIDEMMGATYGSNLVLPVLQILYPNLDYKNSTFHIDHIYPKSKFNAQNKGLPAEYMNRKNELFNLQLLEGTENIQKRDSDPEVWIKGHFINLGEAEEYKERNYIEKDFSLQWENIAKFEEDRTKKIREKLTEVFIPKKA